MHSGRQLVNAVKRTEDKYQGTFPATYSLFPLATPTFNGVSADVHASIKELTIGRVVHRFEIHSDESRHVAHGKKGARQVFSFHTWHHFCRLEVSLVDTQVLRSQGPIRVRAHCTEGGTRSEVRERANGERNGVGDGNDMGKGTRTETETRKGKRARTRTRREW